MATEMVLSHSNKAELEQSLLRGEQGGETKTTGGTAHRFSEPRDESTGSRIVGGRAESTTVERVGSSPRSSQPQVEQPSTCCNSFSCCVRNEQNHDQTVPVTVRGIKVHRCCCKFLESGFFVVSGDQAMYNVELKFRMLQWASVNQANLRTFFAAVFVIATIFSVTYSIRAGSMDQTAAIVCGCFALVFGIAWIKWDHVLPVITRHLAFGLKEYRDVTKHQARQMLCRNDCFQAVIVVIILLGANFVAYAAFKDTWRFSPSPFCPDKYIPSWLHMSNECEVVFGESNWFTKTMGDPNVQIFNFQRVKKKGLYIGLLYNTFLALVALQFVLRFESAAWALPGATTVLIWWEFAFNYRAMETNPCQLNSIGECNGTNIIDQHQIGGYFPHFFDSSLFFSPLSSLDCQSVILCCAAILKLAYDQDRRLRHEFLREDISLWMRRYLVTAKIIHRSATCNVFTAVDIKDNNRPVALKFMKNREEFVREIKSRYGDNNRMNSETLDKCTVGLVGWHIPGDPSLFWPVGTPSEFKASAQLRWRPEGSATIPAMRDYPYVLVLEMGSTSLFLEMVSQRIAGHDDTKIRDTFRTVVECVAQLHSHGLIHSDIKPRNILRMPGGEILLCDLDAALRNREQRNDSFKHSSAYCPPELARHLFACGPAPNATEAFDVWSLGVVLYELCTGQHLFSQDISDDNITAAADKIKLCLWHCVSDQQLSHVFNGNEAKNLIRWCLAGDLSKRPTTADILSHPFLKETKGGGKQKTGVEEKIGEKEEVGEEKVGEEKVGEEKVGGVVGGRQKKEKVPLVGRMKYHVFISHMQIEASGNVGTMFFMLEEMGCHGWRDMNQDDLTEAGMKQGVKDSDVFILFLTNSVLSRPFCLKEIGWALEAEKRIIIVAEEEERFWPFNLQRWMNDECTKDTTVWPHVWVKSENKDDEGKLRSSLGSDYKSCPANIKAEIHRQYESGLVLPYRRRDFEANAMILQVLERAGRDFQPNAMILQVLESFETNAMILQVLERARAGTFGCQWAKHVPKNALVGGGSGGSGEIGGGRKLLLVCDVSSEAGEDTMPLRQTMDDELRHTLRQRGVDLVDTVGDATHALVVLTGGIFREGSMWRDQLDSMVNMLRPLDIVYMCVASFFFFPYSFFFGFLFFSSRFPFLTFSFSDVITSSRLQLVYNKSGTQRMQDGTLMCSTAVQRRHSSRLLPRMRHWCTVHLDQREGTSMWQWWAKCCVGCVQRVMRKQP